VTDSSSSVTVGIELILANERLQYILYNNQTFTIGDLTSS